MGLLGSAKRTLTISFKGRWHQGRTKFAFLELGGNMLGIVYTYQWLHIATGTQGSRSTCMLKTREQFLELLNRLNRLSVGVYQYWHWAE